jgi:hypothetical protein
MSCLVDLFIYRHVNIEKNLMFSEQFGHFLNIMTEEIKDEKIDIEDHFLPAPSISDEDQPEK